MTLIYSIPIGRELSNIKCVVRNAICVGITWEGPVVIIIIITNQILQIFLCIRNVV